VTVIDLTGRVALVTGGTKGIGAAIAATLVAAGADVVTCARSEVADPADGTTHVVCDVRDPAAVQATVDTVVQRRGRLDIVVNNAGGAPYAAAADASPRFHDRVVALNLLGPLVLAQCANRVMQQQAGGGAIVNVSSVSALRPSPGTAAYGAAKAGIAALTLVAAEELERYGVRANAIAPIARTRLTLATPGMGALMAEPDEGEVDLFSPANISPLVAYLATEKCPVTGKVFAVQGGAISELGGWHDVSTIETDGLWEIDDIAARLS